MFDAYTVKKVLPKLVVAAILIQLSWPLFTLLLLATNQISWGLEGLLYAPFGGRDALDISESLTKVASTNDYLLILGGGVAWAAIGAPGVLALAIGIVLALLTAFFVLAIRQVVIVILLVTAPIALVAWILPNTEKIWKLWSGTFSKALLMYPLIILIIAGGRIAAWLVGESGVDGAIGTVLVLFVFFAPFFLIGKTFSFAGGAIASAGGALSGRASGITGGFRKRSMAKQQEKWGSRAAQAKTGDLFSGTKYIPGSNAAADRLNKLTRGAAAGAKFGDKRQAYYDSMSMGTAEDLMKDKNFTGIMYDDNAMRAMTYGSKAEAERALYQRALSEGKTDAEARATATAAAAKASLVGFGGTRSVAAAQRLAMNKTGYADAADAMETISRVTEGNSSMETSLKENIKFTSKQVGRSDLGALSKQREGEDRQTWTDRMTLEGTATADDATLARNHAASMSNIQGAIERQQGGANEELSRKATEAAIDLNSARNWATRANKPNIDAVGEIPTGGTTSTGTVQVVSPNPDNPEELVVSPRSTGSRDETIADIAKERQRGINPDDPRAPGSEE